MGEPSYEEAAHGDVDHGVGDVEPGFVIEHQPAPSCHPPERALDHPAPGQDLEAGLGVGAADDLDDEVAKRGLVEQPGAVKGAVGEQIA